MNGLRLMVVLALALAVAPASASTPLTLAGAQCAGPLVVTHGGVGAPPEVSDGARRRRRRALGIARRWLPARGRGGRRGQDGERPRFNAGTGANIRLDGIVGTNVLRRFRLTIDYPRKMLRLE